MDSYLHVSFDAKELEIYNQIIKNVPEPNNAINNGDKASFI